MARSFGEDAALGTKKASDLRAKYDRLEAKAKREKLGAWGDGAATPTMELSSGSEKQGEPISTDVTDITPSMTDVLSVPLD
jgi:endonuclease YncB( thermonuclease family)